MKENKKVNQLDGCMIKPTCSFCNQELIVFGGNIYGPPVTYPDKNDLCTKDHLCINCYEWIMLVKKTGLKPKPQVIK
jgi:hypothetical protein